MRRLLISIAGALALFSPAASLAQKVPIGTDFQVNQQTYGYQGVWRGPDVTADAAGNFTVVWDGYGYPNVGGRRFDSTGTPLGPDFHFGFEPSPYPGDGVDDPAISANASGEFVVVWQDVYAGYESYGMAAQRYDSTGTPLGTPFQVNTFETNGPRNPKVAVDSAGNFMVVWGQFYTDGPGISGQLFDAAGSPVGGEFQVDMAVDDSDGYNGIEEDDDGIEIAAGAAGNFMVVWENYQYGYGRRILGRLFDAAAMPSGPPFQVNADPQYPGYPGIAADGLGNFVVAWRDYDRRSVFAQRYDSAGSAVGSNFQVNVPGAGRYVSYTKVAADGAGNFVVVWQAYPFVRVRQFDSSGAPLGGEFQLPQGGYDPQARAPDVAFTAAGEFVVAWGEYRGYGYYEYSHDIFAQRFGDSPGPCAPFPRTTCRGQVLPRGVFAFKENSNPARRRLVWRWPKGEATARENFGDPVPVGGTDYAFCAYDASGQTQPVVAAAMPAGGTCGLLQCWRELAGPGQKVEYFHTDGNADGVRRVRLRPGGDGKARMSLQGRGSNLTLPALPLVAPVMVQLQASNGECWTATYDAFIKKNEGDRFRAKPGTTASTTSSTVTTTTVSTTTSTTLPPVCGNLVLEAGEECDDGNTDGGDGCSSTCTCNPATAPPACGLTGDWSVVGMAGLVTIVESAAGESTMTGTISGFAIASQATRSSSCGTGTMTQPLAISFRFTVNDACDAQTHVTNGFGTFTLVRAP